MSSCTAATQRPAQVNKYTNKNCHHIHLARLDTWSATMTGNSGRKVSISIEEQDEQTTDHMMYFICPRISPSSANNVDRLDKH
jgi:hypothetical protein